MDIAAAENAVYETLQQATSQITEILKPAEQRLQEWETEPGFYTILLNIFSNHSVDVNVRWLAVLCFKNGIDRYWRKTAPNTISEVEKVRVRQTLLRSFQEPINQIAIQLAVIISKIARFDCPREWSDLIPTLLTAVESEDHVVQHRALLVLHHVIKTLSSKRLVGDRRFFQELTENVFSFILNLWNRHTALAISQLSAKTLENALLSLKILHELMIHGFKKPHESHDANEFLKMVFDRAKTMLICRKSVRGSLVILVEKFIIKMTKVLLAVLENHPLSFVDYIHPSLAFTVHYAFTAEGEPLLFERFLIQCLNLLKGILMCSEYKSTKVMEETREPDALRAHHMKMTFFDTMTLNVLCRKLITHYFLLTQQDLQLWDNDPESFVSDEGGECWKYSLRPCTESLFLGLFHEFYSILSPLLLELIQQNHAPVDPFDLPAILSKDAVYNAVGLAAFDMYDEINFDHWFTTSLQTELKIRTGNYRVIRRRVVWLLGQWTGVKLSSALRPALYAAMLPLLQPHEDMVVRLTACNTIKMVVDDFEFNTEQFLDYLEPSFGLLFLLLKECHECDTKMHVLYVLSFIIERVSSAIRPHAECLIQYLPLLWEESIEHNMLRCAIVSTLVHLVHALGSLSENQFLSPFLLHVIQLSTDIRLDSHVYLKEDGLELWLAVLENSSKISPQLLLLFSNMPQILEMSSDNPRTNFYIIQAYTLLAPEEFLQVYGEVVVSSCMYLLSDLRSEGVVMMMKLLEICIRANPTRGIQLLEPALPQLFQAVYNGEEFPMVMSMYLSIMARILFISIDVFSKVIVCISEAIGRHHEEVMGHILDVWLDKMSLVTQPERSKMLALALASLLTSQSTVVLDRICGILLSISEVLNDITRTDDMGIQLDSLIWNGQDSSPTQFNEVDYKNEHDYRRKNLAASDPVYQLELQKYLRSQLVELQRQVGHARFSQLLQTVDAETMQQVKEYIVLN